MFTYIKLKNFLSLDDVVFDFRKNQTMVNKIAVVYGENGSGKTNFVRAFNLLYDLFHTFSFQQRYENALSIIKDLPSSPSIIEIKEHLSLYSDFTEYLSTQRMIDCDEPTTVEYGFMVNGKEAIYHVSFTNRIIEEYLYAFTGKQRGMLFDISSDENEEIHPKLQSSLILQTTYKKEIIEKIQQYWGKHTFISILSKQIQDKNKKFIEDSISPYLLNAITQLTKFSIKSKESKKENMILYHNDADILMEFESGIIPKSEKSRIYHTEKIIRDFFTQTYADIKDVEYEIAETSDNKLKYQLYVYKMINEKVRKISFSQESAGTQQVLDIIRSLVGLFFGVTVVYDEIDNGVHDILLTQIIKSLQGEISGQLIITTHNTMLLEEMDEHCVYIISTDYMGKKSVHSAAEYGIQTNHNLRVRYLKGLLGGVPYVDGVDYENIEQILAERGNLSWQENSNVTM